MSSKKQEVNAKALMELEKAIAYLRDLADSLHAGEIHVQHGGEYLTLTPLPEVLVEVTAKRKREKEKFSLSVSWCTEEQAPKSMDLNISSEKPEGLNKIEAVDEDEEADEAKA